VYRSKITNFETLVKAMTILGFVKIEGKNSFKQDGCHIVHTTHTKEDTYNLSSDFHWGAKSQKMSRIVGGQEFEQVNSQYNRIVMTEQFEAKGYTVETEDSLNEEGELEMLVTLEDYA